MDAAMAGMSRVRPRSGWRVVESRRARGDGDPDSDAGSEAFAECRDRGWSGPLRTASAAALPALMRWHGYHDAIRVVSIEPSRGMVTMSTGRLTVPCGIPKPGPRVIVSRTA